MLDWIRAAFFITLQRKPSMTPVRAYGRRRRKGDITGKKIVYITPYRNLALEMKKTYEAKGEKTVIEAERNEDGQTMYLVCIFPR